MTTNCLYDFEKPVMKYGWTTNTFVPTDQVSARAELRIKHKVVTIRPQHLCVLPKAKNWLRLRRDITHVFSYDALGGKA